MNRSVSRSGNDSAKAQAGDRELDLLRKEAEDYELRVESLRNALQRSENDVNRIDCLRHAVFREQGSVERATRIARLLPGIILPELVRWAVRPVTRWLKRMVRRISNGDAKAPYDIKVVHAGDSRKRVLHAIANFMTGGSSQLVVDLIEGLGDSYEQQVVTGFLPSPVAYAGAIVGERSSYYGILALIERFRPDLLHVHYWGDVDFAWYDKLFRAAEKAGCRIVENVNTPVVPYRSYQVQTYVYVSDYVKQIFGRPSDNGIVIHPGSNLSLFSRDRDMRPAADCVGMVYRLESDKLDEQSIDVFLAIAERRPECRFLIVGSGSLRISFESAVSAVGAADRFTFTGAVPYGELPELYSQMSIFVAPVWKESFGQVSCFAMSMGVPVVGYRVGGLSEIVDDTRLLATPGDSDELAEIAIGLLDDVETWQSVVRRNKERVRSLFALEHMVSEYRQLYSRLLKGQQ